MVLLPLPCQASASKYGSMTIHQCAEMCRHDATCRYIQYDCNTEPRTCERKENSLELKLKSATCGTRIQKHHENEPHYKAFRDVEEATALDLLAQFVDTVVFFAQFSSLLCSLQAANLHQFNCDAWVQWVLAEDCWLLTACDSQLTSTCGSSIYQSSTPSNSPGSTYLLADGHMSITYSPTSCSVDDCSWPSFCPSQICE